HQTVDVHMLEWHAPGEVLGHHDHPGNPEEDDVVASDQHGGRQVQVEVVVSSVGLVGPAHGGKRHHGGRIPRVQHIGIAAQCFAGGLCLGFGFVLCDVDVAFFVVPGWNLMA